jgi:hypothetical protein
VEGIEIGKLTEFGIPQIVDPVEQPRRSLATSTIARGSRITSSGVSSLRPMNCWLAPVKLPGFFNRPSLADGATGSIIIDRTSELTVNILACRNRLFSL